MTRADTRGWQRLLRGQAPARPFFVPLVHALGAQVEGWDVEPFLHDVAKLVRSGEALWRALGVDAIVSAGPSAAEAEALGAELDWTNYPPAVVTPPELDVDALRAGLERGGRLASAIEATRRLSATPGLDVPVVAGLTGPWTLAVSAAGGAVPDRVQVERAGGVVREIARSFAAAGASGVIVVEEKPAPDTADQWRDELRTFAKVVRFHRAAPFVVVPGSLRQERLGQPGSAPMVCPSSPATPQALGRALATDPHRWPERSPVIGFLTTVGEISPRADIADVARRSADVLAALADSTRARDAI